MFKRKRDWYVVQWCTWTAAALRVASARDWLEDYISKTAELLGA
jgi:hypothetical protein